MTWSIISGFRLTCLFSCGPKGIRDVLGHDPTPKGGGLSIFGDLDAAQLIHIDLDAMGHLPQRGDSSVRAIEDEEGQTLLVCVFHLTRN